MESTIGGDTLGWHFDEGRPQVMITPRRLWKLKLGIDELLSQGWASGKLIEKIVGHLTFAALLRRELLSCFEAVYVFVRKHYHTKVRLWPQVRRELFWAKSLLPLVCRDLGAEWCSEVHASDASTWGRGVAVMKSDVEKVRAQARIQDRWRFNREQEHSLLRSEVVGAGAFGGILEYEKARLNEKSLPVPELDPSFMNGDWRRVESRAWSRQEPIVILEGRALVWTVQHLVRSGKNHGKRHLIISDSMSNVLSLSKGRGGTSSSNRICRQIGSLSLACGLQLHFRWCASEINAADGPSRGKPIGKYDFLGGVKELIDAQTKIGSASSWRRQAALFYEGCLFNPDQLVDFAQRRAELAGWGRRDREEQGPSTSEADEIGVSPKAHSQEERGSHVLGEQDGDRCKSQELQGCLGKAEELCQVPLPPHEVTGGSGGEGIASAMTLLASVKFHRSDVTKLSVLIRAMEAMRGFRKLSPPQARVPVPFPMVAQLCLYFCQVLQKPWAAVWLLMTWATCSRPGECLKLTTEQLVAPNRINPKWSVILSPSSSIEGKGQPSKTGEMDEGITLDHPYLEWMKVVFQHIKQKRPVGSPMIPHTMRQLSVMFAKAVDGCGFQDHGIQCSYQVRHGSASTDMLQRQRSMEELMKRGRWRTLTSLRRYEQGGRLSQVFGKLSKCRQETAIKAEQNLPAVLTASLGCKKPRATASSSSCSQGNVA